MNSNVVDFSAPREAPPLAVNLRVCGEVNNDGHEAAFAGIVGESSGLRNVLQLGEMVAATDATVLLLSETGTGKELIARAIHEHSQRQRQSFVALNCAAIPSSTIPESTIQKLQRWSWPGNVRKFENLIERSVILTRNSALSVSLPETQRSEGYRIPKRPPVISGNGSRAKKSSDDATGT